VIEHSLKVMQVHAIEFVKPEALERAAKIEFVAAYGFGALGQNRSKAFRRSGVDAGRGIVLINETGGRAREREQRQLRGDGGIERHEVGLIARIEVRGTAVGNGQHQAVGAVQIRNPTRKTGFSRAGAGRREGAG